MAGMTELRIVHDIFRRRTTSDDDQVLVIAAGVYNHRCALRDAARLAQAVA